MMFGWLGRRVADGNPAGPATSLPLDRLIALRTAAAGPRRPSGRGVTHMPGEKSTRMRGEGIEFDDLRPYAEGDDPRHIDWNVTARTGHVHTRLYREERQTAHTVAVDLRRSMFTGSRRLRGVVAGEIAGCLAWRIVANRDRAAAFVFGDTLTVTRPLTGQRGALEVVGAVAAGFLRQVRPAEAHPPQKLSEVIHRLNAAGRAFGAFLLVTGFDEPGAGIEPALMEAGRRGRLAVLLVEDPLETDGLPPGSYRYSNGETTSIAHLDRSTANHVRAELRRQNGAIRALLARCGVPFVVASAAEPPEEVVWRLGRHGLL